MHTNKPLFVICANTSFDENPLGAKPLAVALADHCDVIYVDPPLSYVTTIKQPQLRRSLFAKRFSKITPTMWRLIPIVAPGKDRPLIHHVTSYLLRRKIQKAIKKCGRAYNEVMIIATAPHYKVFSKEAFNIYWVMDDYASQPSLTGISPAVLEKGQKDLARSSDINVFVSEYLRTSFDATESRSAVIHNGADSRIFTFPTAPEDQLPQNIASRLPEKFALYVGGVSERIDFDYLRVLGRSHPLVIAGNVDSRVDRKVIDDMCEHQNVTYLGAIENIHVPALMNAASVGIVPYADTTFNRSSMPLKIPEYLMCGLPVVSRDLDFVKTFNHDDVYGESTPEAFTQRVSEIMLEGPTPGQRAMRSARIAQEWSWVSKAQEFLDLFPRQGS